MTDSTTGGEGSGFDAGPSIDELFGAVEEEPLEPEPVTEPGEEPADDVEDRTAGEVFEAFRREADGHDVDDVLGEESPDDIITGATEAESTEAENEFLDEDALDALLLTGRREEDEFLWVETDTSSDDGAEGDGPASTEPGEASTDDGALEDAGPESESELESAHEPVADRESGSADALETEPDESTDALEPSETATDDGESADADDSPDDDAGGLLDRVRSSLGL